MIKQILILAGIMFSALIYAFRAGKKSVEINENKNAIKQIQRRNATINSARKLNDSELDKRVQQFTKRK